VHFVNITYALCLLKDVIVMNKLSIYLASNVLTSLSVVFAGVKKKLFSFYLCIFIQCGTTSTVLLAVGWATGRASGL